MTVRILVGDCRRRLLDLPDRSVHCVVTSPPYWALRDYGAAGQLGLEATPDAFVASLVAVFREVRRVLRDDGTLWLNLGDSYATRWATIRPDSARGIRGEENGRTRREGPAPGGLKDKDLVGIPWRAAFALQDDGWWLRRDIIWAKPHPMPESVEDRCTTAHEYLFHLAKSARYYYDAEAIREPVTGGAHTRGDGVNPKARWKTPDGWDTSTGNGGHGGFHRNGREAGRVKQNASFSAAVTDLVLKRNKRSVWTIATAPFPEAHFATFPPDLVKPCVLAGCPHDGVVLDPFAGAGTALLVAKELGRRAIGIELKPEYIAMTVGRLRQDVLPLVPAPAP